MPQNTHLEIISAEAERLPEVAWEASDVAGLRAKAAELARKLAWLPGVSSSRALKEHCYAVKDALRPLLIALESARAEPAVSDDFRWLYDNSRLLSTELQATSE